MRRRVRSPEELGEPGGKKKGFNCYLGIDLYEAFVRRAAQVKSTPSKLINEAMHLYMERFRDEEKKGKS